MTIPIIALLLFGAPSTSQNTVVSNETAVVAPQTEKTIPLDIKTTKD